MQSLGLRNAISTCGYIYIDWLRLCIAYSRLRNNPLPLAATYYSSKGYLVKISLQVNSDAISGVLYMGFMVTTVVQFTQLLLLLVDR